MISPILPVYSGTTLGFERGEGAYVWTPDGDKYLDFTSGIAVNALGHCHPHLVAALTEQAGRLWHTSNVFRIGNQVSLAERLVAVTFADTVFFTNSGTEAVECAIKMARKHHAQSGAPERTRFVTMEGAFHGRTLGALAATGNQGYLDGFGPPLPGFDQVPFADIDAVKKAIGPETAALLVEPIQGEGGVRVMSNETLRQLRKLCDETGVLLVLDEVQCGMGRTGRLFHYQWSGIEPDILTAAKGLGGGFPIGACLATERAASGMVKGSHGSTFGGNPMATAVGSAVLDVMLAPGFMDKILATSNQMRQGLAAIVDRYPDIIAEVRGEGLLLGLKAVIPNTDLVEAFREQNFLTPGGGENVVRLLPPLIIGEAEVSDALERIDRACAAVSARMKDAASTS